MHAARAQPAALPARPRAGGLGRRAPSTPTRPAASSPTAGCSTGWCGRSGGSPSRWCSSPTARSSGFTLVRAITSVLLEAFRAGGAQGRTPRGGVPGPLRRGQQPARGGDARPAWCARSQLAPATPMEFIRILLTPRPPRARWRWSRRERHAGAPAARLSASWSRSTRPTPTCRPAQAAPGQAGRRRRRSREVSGLGAELEVIALPRGRPERLRPPAPGAPHLGPDHAQDAAWSAGRACGTGTRPA